MLQENSIVEGSELILDSFQPKYRKKQLMLVALRFGEDGFACPG